MRKTHSDKNQNNPNLPTVLQDFKVAGAIRDYLISERVMLGGTRKRKQKIKTHGRSIKTRTSRIR